MTQILTHVDADGDSLDIEYDRIPNDPEDAVVTVRVRTGEALRVRVPLTALRDAVAAYEPPAPPAVYYAVRVESDKEPSGLYRSRPNTPMILNDRDEAKALAKSLPHRCRPDPRHVHRPG